MVHVTSVPEDVFRKGSTALEPHARGFTTGALGDCVFLVAFWDFHGVNAAEGRAHHVSGGASTEDVDALVQGLDGEDVTLVFVTGSTYTGQAETVLGRTFVHLRELAARRNWGVTEYAWHGGGPFIITTGLQYVQGSVLDARPQPSQRPKNARCCVVM